MSKPIAQTFYINEPQGGAEGVYITRIDVYFESVSSVYGVELQIRTTDNGNPTPFRLPDAFKVLQVNDVYPVGHPLEGTSIIRASNDGSVATQFIFDTPVFVQSLNAYAFMIIPLGGNPDYKVWTAEIGGTDVRTNTPIFKNNDTGTLFLSSNDIQFTSILTEDIKFDIYTADFTYNEGKAVYTPTPMDNIVGQGLIGSFIPNELVFMSAGSLNLASLTYSGATGSFTLGETIYQSNGTANVATGKLWSVDGTKFLLENCTGSWTTSYQVKGVTSLSNATISAVSQNVVSSANTTISVPFVGNSTATYFSNEQPLYIGTNNRSIMDVKYITNVPTGGISTSLTIDSNTTFSDNNSLFGKIRGTNTGLSTYAFYTGPRAADLKGDYEFTFFMNHTPNTYVDSTHNFANSQGEFVIGYNSKASVTCFYTRDIPYSVVVPKFSESKTKSTDITWDMSSIDTNNVYDPGFTKIVNYDEKEYFDKIRRAKSRSFEIIENGANNTTQLRATLTSSNNKVSPYIDIINNSTTLIRNMIVNDKQTSGYIIDIENLNGRFLSAMHIEDNVSQSNGTTVQTGGLLFANESLMYVSAPSGSFEPGYTIYSTANPSVNAEVIAVRPYDEKYPDDVGKAGARYISKSVTLADQQDAEDLQSYLTAYRPALTNFKVYARFLNAQDPDLLSKKIWSRMPETSSPALLSSGVNQEDFVELVYNLPETRLVFSNSVTCINTSANITVSSTLEISNGSYVYVYNTSSNTFIVRQVVAVPNNSTLTLDSNCSFSSSNADIGIIPNLEDKTAAFKFANNNGIIRYVSNTDVVYDTFKYFAMKIVPVSENPAVVPRAADMRCLALQV